MKSLRIIESFSIIFLLSFGMLPFAGAQDLEEVLPRKVEVSVIDYSDDFEPSITSPPAMDSTIMDDLEASNADIATQIENKHEEVIGKEVQLGMILRSAYYQKITTPRWAKILSTESWRASFLKWRYYAQIEDYVRSSSEVVSKIKMDPSIEIVMGEPKEIEVVNNNQQKAILNTSLDDVINTDEVSIAEEVIPLNQKEVTEEETFDTDSAVVEEVVFDFSISDLSLPDSLISEQELYASIAVAIPEPSVNSMEPVASVPLEPVDEKLEEEKKVIILAPKEPEVVAVVVEAKPAKSEPKIQEKESNSQEIIITKPAEKAPPKPTPVLAISDRRTMTERFSSMYGNLPWPVSGGAITDRYGYRKNAEARGLKRENYGVDIAAPSSSRVRAVFSGVVLMAINQAPYDYIITIKHGDYTTAYYFLEKINVKVGDEVQVGHGLGTLRQQEGAAPFHFEIWQDQERVNPEPWLKS